MSKQNKKENKGLFMITLIDETGTKVGDMRYSEARNIADSKSFDLILVNKSQQIYKLGDLGKMKYDKKQKAKKNKLNQKANKLKEIQMRPTIDIGDLEVKKGKIRAFLSEGMRTKVVMRFKKHQMVYKDIGLKKIDDMIKELVAEGLIAENNAYQVDNRQILVLLTPLG